jgi:hypothetical protein
MVKFFRAWHVSKQFRKTGVFIILVVELRLQQEFLVAIFENKLIPGRLSLNPDYFTITEPDNFRLHNEK